MTAAEKPPPKGIAALLRGVLRGGWMLIRNIALVIICVWGSLALYYSNLPWPWGRVLLSVAFATFSIWALWVSRTPGSRLAFWGVFFLVLVWFRSIPPSNDRKWKKDVAVMPRAVIEGDRVRLTGVRNFDYHSRDDFTVNYEEREVLLSDLNSVDLFISYWSLGPVGHTFVSFNFDNALPVCISIETRPEEGQGFDPLASVFRQFELIYVLGDERDLVRSRTNYRDEKVLLYPLKTSPEAARSLFLVYLERINELADKAEWYHLLKNNCTLNIVRYKNVAGREGSFDFRHLLNGWIDRYFFETDMINTSLPFADLRRRSWINDAAQASDDSKDFSREIREDLPEQ